MNIENDQDIRNIVDSMGRRKLRDPKHFCTGEPWKDPEIKPDDILIEFINRKPGRRLCRKIKQVDPLKAE